MSYAQLTVMALAIIWLVFEVKATKKLRKTIDAEKTDKTNWKGYDMKEKKYVIFQDTGYVSYRNLPNGESEQVNTYEKIDATEFTMGEAEKFLTSNLIGFGVIEEAE